MNVMTLPIPPPTGGTIVVTMGLIQEYTHPSHNIYPFTYEHILRHNGWLSKSDWMFDNCKSVENSVNNITVILISTSNDDYQCVYISYPYDSYPYQLMMMINVSISHIHLKR